MINLLKARLSRSQPKELKDSGGTLSMRRTSSDRSVVRESLDSTPQVLEEPALMPSRRSRANTFTNGVSRPAHLPLSASKSSGNATPIDDKLREQLSQFTSPRHYQRRSAVVEDDIRQLSPSSTVGAMSVLVKVEEGNNKVEDSAPVVDSMSLGDLVEMLMFKNDFELENENLDVYSVSATFQDSPIGNVTLSQPSSMFAGHTVLIRPKEALISEGKQPESAAAKPPAQEFKTVANCLSYFSDHGLVELPLLSDDDQLHLPRVQPIDPIVTSWYELPIDPQLRDSLDRKEKDQQQAIWEFIYTEHSHIRQLETVINVFMRCLELIRRTKLLSNETYHNMFGYMEDIYHAHDQFWTWTLEPILEKVYERGQPLDLNEIINRFPEFGVHFEIYEQHCQLEALNLHALKKAKENPDFTAYLEWCESQPQCHRLGLDQFLATPMQRLTRYPLLISAINKKTTQPHLKQRLEHLCEEMQDFVQCVNTGIMIQEETERVRDVMSRLTGFQVVDIPNELKDVVQPYTHLDLLAPMAGVEVDRARVLMLEGTLKYRDSTMSKMAPLHLFLFTDMLLITKLSSRKGGDKYTIFKEPYKIDRLVLHTLEPGSFCAVVVSEFQVASSWFILKANSPKVATEWMEQINRAQLYYTEAVERRTQQWKLLQNLQSERILDGIEGMDSLSASLWSVNLGVLQNMQNKGLSASSNSLLLKRKSSPIIHPLIKKPLIRTNSEDQAKQFVMRNFNDTRSPSLDLLLECPESPAKFSNTPTRPRLALSQICLSSLSPSFVKQGSEESLSSSLQRIPSSPLSEDSGTESGGTISADGITDSQEKIVTDSGASCESTQDMATTPIADSDMGSRSGQLKSILKQNQNRCPLPSNGFNTSQDLKIPGRQLSIPNIPLNRVPSDDSGIALKPLGIKEYKDQLDDLQSPSAPTPARISMPAFAVSIRPPPKTVHFRSQSDSSLRHEVPHLGYHKAAISPVNESVLGSEWSSFDTPSPHHLSSMQLIEQEISTSQPGDSMPKAPESTLGMKPAEWDALSSVLKPNPPQTSKATPTATSPQASKVPTVKKKPLRRIAAVSHPDDFLAPRAKHTSHGGEPSSKIEEKRTAGKEPAKKKMDESQTEPKRKADEQKKTNDERPKSPSIAKKAAPSKDSTTSGDKGTGAVKRKSSQLRKPSITIKETISVKEVRQKFESTQQDRSPKPSKLPSPSQTSTAPSRKRSQPATAPKPPRPGTHGRSKSDMSGTNFIRQGARRGKASPPISRALPPSKTTTTQKQSVSRSTSATSIPKGRPPKGMKLLKTPKRGSVEETGHDSDQDSTLTQLAALTPQSSPHTPRSNPKRFQESSDTRIGIELSGGSERGIDVPLNFNSNNNTSSQLEPERSRKVSTYDILDAVTIKPEEDKKPSCHQLRKRSPLEWNRFGYSWRQPHNHTSGLGHSKSFHYSSRYKVHKDQNST